ncbi:MULTISPECIES: phenazine biosynthesis protein [Streptomyces]|uniref:phenazine biosynthesis protein n=1 Tax=Streptomyces TaxID=1883 RepID=UPI000A36C777|nr:MULTISPECIES: phenazine biosynthesis protein [Streptomyces]MDN5383865.1 phenazine biosynthesis protein [Streptomyces sp. LB8]
MSLAARSPLEEEIGSLSAEEHLRAVLEWHFDERTGSPFWLRKRTELGFDPLRDITGLADLRRFPDVSAELRTVPVDDLIPAGSKGRPVGVYESGGTLGAPKRIIESTSRARSLAWVNSVLTDHDFPQGVHWLHIGPTGPHIVGRSMRLLAEMRGGICFTVDFDPRWVKRLIADGRRDEADAYVQHVLDQAELIVTHQRVGVLFITPPVLEALCARPALHERLTGRLGGLIWSGTSISAGTLRLVEEEYFPGTTVVGLYGNSLMGIAPQLPRDRYPAHRCVFRTHQPQSVVEVVDPQTGARVPVGERGRVLVHLLSQDMFLPNVAERDSVVRAGTPEGAHGDDVADIRPYTPTAGTTVIEGVY